MPNAIQLFQTYLPMLDEVYKVGSTSAIFDGINDGLVRMADNGRDFLIPKMTMSGLGDYTRNGDGYPKGNVALAYETKSPNYDRGVELNVEDQDNMETNGLAFGRLGGEFVRTQVVPELDAFRYAKYCEFASEKITDADLTTGEGWLEAIRRAMRNMDNNEVPTEGRVLRITATGLDMIEHLDITKRTTVMSRFANVGTVPSGRFYSAIKLNTGRGETPEFGYEKATGASDLAFEIIHPSALLQHRKSLITKAFSPEEVQGPDVWKIFYHDYSICECMDNKKNGITACLGA